MKIKIQKLHENAVIPHIATAGAACVDVVATEIEYTPGSNEAIVHLGFATEIPEGYKACLAPRSSFTKFNWIMQNSPAQIDADYRGEYMLKFKAIPSKFITTTAVGELPLKQPKVVYSGFPYKVGDRVAQMWFEKVIDYEFEEVADLSDTDRGAGGFGSTGV
jgi:dUTP pyrophosphatase